VYFYKNTKNTRYGWNAVVAVETLFGSITGPYLVDGGDIIIVTEDAFILSSEYNTGALENLSDSNSGITIIVDGTLQSTGE